MLDKVKSSLTCPQCREVCTNSKGERAVKNFDCEPHTITDFDPDNYQNGWIIFYSVGMQPIVVDCKNDRCLMESVDVFGLSV